MSSRRSSRRRDAQKGIPVTAATGEPPAQPAESRPATSPPPPPRQYRRRLGNFKNVRAGLADVIRKLEAEEYDVKRGNALVYAYGTLANVMEAERRLDEFEERVVALEAALAGRAVPAGLRSRRSPEAVLAGRAGPAACAEATPPAQDNPSSSEPSPTGGSVP